MIDQSNQFYAQRHAQFSHLPGDMLLSLALNENGEWRFRKAAVEIMLEKKYEQVKHPALAQLREEVEFDHTAKEEVIDAVETALEGPIDHSHQGVFDFGHGSQKIDDSSDYHKAQLSTFGVSEPDVKVEVESLKEEPKATGPLVAGFTTQNF
jgi:hypothetical protein